MLANNVKSAHPTDNQLCQLLWCPPHPQLFPSLALLSSTVLSWVWPIWCPRGRVDSMLSSVSVNQKLVTKESSLYLIEL